LRHSVERDRCCVGICCREATVNRRRYLWFAADRSRGLL